jgi:hypothetical protein
VWSAQAVNSGHLMSKEATVLSTGEVKYRPPKGKPEDRLLALATGKTEDGLPAKKAEDLDLKDDE